MYMQNASICTLNGPTGLVAHGFENVESRLVEAAKGGQAAAFAALCERYAKQLFRAAQNITRSHEDAEDAVQDALLSAFVHLRNFDGRSTFGTWLTRIAINSALMILRKRRNAPVADLGGAEDSSTGEPHYELPDHAPNPEMHFAKKEEARILRSAVQELRPALREVVQKQQLQESSMREIATAMGISVAAAKARLFHAKIKLRKSSMLRMMRRRTGGPMRVLSAA
jgi:RNA polymerase sigma-70 factor (ECF subfamily)